ncbi:MAG: ABC transporter substrate-binding protein [bacterium]
MRRFLITILSVVLLLAIGGISPRAQMKYKEAPMLAELVRAGKLPPVEERLPKEPLVLPVVEEIGQYGGTWRRAFTGPADSSNYWRITYDSLLRWSRDGNKVIPNLAKGWEFSEGGKVLTLKLREGVKWSDGASFTADDIVFWYEDIVLNNELSPSKPAWMRVGRELGKLEKVDDYTVRFRFAKPYGLIIQWLAGGEGGDVITPKHYLKQFHPRYVSKEKLDAMTKDAKLEFWYQLFNNKNNEPQNPDRPVIKAWYVVEPITSKRFVLERNPYYWKVDPVGNQLPYIDRIVMDFVEDIEVLNMKAVAGDLDMQGRHILITNYPLLKKNAEKGDYRILLWPNSGGTDAGLMFNQNYVGDPVIADLLRNRQFRIALSHAINREEINNLAFLGLGKPMQMAPLEGSIYYEKEFATKYTEYDPGRANEILDSIGLNKRDAQGFRLRPDGKTLEITIAAVPAFGPWPDVAEMTKGYWEDVGVKTAVDIQERSLHYNRLQAGELQVSVWNTGGNAHVLVYPWWTMGWGSSSRIAPLSGVWLQSEGKSGVEPPGDLMKIVELRERAIATTDEQEQIRLVKEIFRLNTENLWTIGTVGGSPMVMGVIVVKNNFRNVPEVAHNDVVVHTPGNADPPQFFFKK